MRGRYIVVSACLVLALAGLALWSINHDGKNPETLPAVVTKPAIRHRSATGSPAPSKAPPTPQTNDETLNQPIEPLLEQIHDASVTYDPRELIKIQPFLTHPNAEIRKAAVDGMITLGDASAGSMLREASKSAPTPQEAVAMLEAADYVELPSARLIDRKAKRPPGDKPLKSRVEQERTNK